MIERARELARLAENATPGPWYVGAESFIDKPWRWVRSKNDGECVVGQYDHEEGGVVRCEADAKLIAAAPEITELLCEMADALERARELLYHEMEIDAEVRDIARRVLGGKVDGDEYGVPRLPDIVEILVDKVS